MLLSERLRESAERAERRAVEEASRPCSGWGQDTPESLAAYWRSRAAAARASAEHLATAGK